MLLFKSTSIPDELSIIQHKIDHKIITCDSLFRNLSWKSLRMDNSQHPHQHIPNAMQSQILHQQLDADLLDLTDPKISEAQVSMEPVIEKIFEEARTMREGTVPNWENMDALGTSLDAIDIDSINPRTYRDPAVLERTRPAKLRIVELLYEYAKEMSKRELASLLLYVTTLMGEMEEDLLDGEMGEGYWTALWLDKERFYFGVESYSDEEEYDEVNDASYKDPYNESEYETTDTNTSTTGVGVGDCVTHDMVDESMKE